MNLSKKVKTALDETRLLILGAQILLGFQLQGVFQERFASLSFTARLLDCLGQLLMTITVGLLIAPSMHHLIAEHGEDTKRLLRITSLYAGLALLPFAISVGLSLYIVFELDSGAVAGIIAGAAFFALAMLLWYALAWLVKMLNGKRAMNRSETVTPLSARIEQMLTEARVILPGAQALLGFQLVVTLTRTFELLPESSRMLHMAALCSVAVATILLMVPAALHRISFAGENTESFFRMGSWFVMIAPAPLASGIAADLYVASTQASGSMALGAAIGLASLVALVTFWYTVPFYVRTTRPATRSFSKN
jgi:hypothetical protein